MKAVTVPFFISHQGCPHTCIFCDQRTISGVQGILPDPEHILAKIELWRGTAGDRPVEVAFFGGTFTALSHEIQAELLAPLQNLLKNGLIRSVRISTRPDYIDSDSVNWLSKLGVRTIELGVQSLDDAVLIASGRGHFAKDSLDAIRCIKNCGVSVGAQLMPGLPGDSTAISISSLEQAIKAGADFLRIYPTVVLKGTELARRYMAGDFIPLSLESGISLSAILLQRAMMADIPVIRIGLQADTGLDSDHLLAGCWHPALGQLVRSRLYSDLILNLVATGESVIVHCHPKRYSDVLGIRRSNLQIQKLRGVDMQVLTDKNIKKEEIIIDAGGKSTIYSIIKDLHYSTHEV